MTKNYIEKYENIKSHIETKWRIDFKKKEFKNIPKMVRDYINEDLSEDTILYLISDYLRRCWADIVDFRYLPKDKKTKYKIINGKMI